MGFGPFLLCVFFCTAFLVGEAAVCALGVRYGWWSFVSPVLHVPGLLYWHAFGVMLIVQCARLPQYATDWMNKWIEVGFGPRDVVYRGIGHMIQVVAATIFLMAAMKLVVVW